MTEDRDWDARVIAPAEVLVRYYGLPYDQAERVILNAAPRRGHRRKVARMNFEETRAALEGLWGDDVTVELWAREPGSHAYLGSGKPVPARLSVDTVVIDPTTFESAEWRDQPGPGSLWILHGNRATSVTPKSA